MAKRWVIVVAEFDEEVSTISGGPAYVPASHGALTYMWTRDGTRLVTGQVVHVAVTDGSLPFTWPEP